MMGATATPNSAELSPAELRKLMVAALPEDLAAFRPAEARHVYFPPSHAKALRPDAMVISGMRGAGKSFWWWALQQPEIRSILAQVEPRVEIEEKTRIAVGFGAAPSREYPSRDVLGRLRNEGHDARLIWKAVVLRHHVPHGHPLDELPGWGERVAWLADHPEEAGRLLLDSDEELARHGVWHITIFDALDRSASDWPEIHALIRGLLQLAVELRGYERIRIKCFLREDQLDEDRIGRFPDASKLLATKVDLSWDPEDLYGMLWQYIANGPEELASRFRPWAERHLGEQFQLLRTGPSPDSVAYRVRRPQAEGLRKLFHRIAGEWMGAGPKRGFTDRWIPNHLADAKQRTSPRSFLAALRTAAEETATRYPEHKYALHYESIKAGVRKASLWRVRELAEDYPWVEILMRALEGLTVPCEFREVRSRWSSRKVIERIKEEGPAIPLMPARFSEGFEGLRKDLEELGVFQRLTDGRVNIPDVFRIGYGLGRKGGVKPSGR